MEKLLLVDGNSIMNRAFFGLPLLTNHEGVYTNAVYGFLNILNRVMEEESATHVTVAFDLRAPTFRHDMYSDYKGNRKGMPDELRSQMPLVKEVLNAMHIPIYQMEGFEADDILGTLASIGEDAGYSVTLLSGDKDMLQLATDKVKISIPRTKGGQTTVEHYYATDVVEKIGVSPKEFIDVKGLMGDTSDNIPGVPGIGEKTAVKIIAQCHDIETAINSIDQLPKRAAKLLGENVDLARMSKELAAIKTDVPLDMSLDDTVVEDMYNKKVYDMFVNLGFTTLLKQFDLSDIASEPAEPMEIVELEADDVRNYIFDKESYSLYFYSDDSMTGIALTSDGKKIELIETPSVPFSQIRDWLEMLGASGKRLCTHDFKDQLHVFGLDGSSVYFQDGLTPQLNDLSLMLYIINPIGDNYNVDAIGAYFSNATLVPLDLFLGKGKSRKNWADLAPTDRQDYAAQCAKALFASEAAAIETLKKENLLDLYNDMERPLLFVLYEVECLGVKVDTNMLKAYGEKLASQIANLEESIYEEAGETFNINSPKQLGHILFEKLNLPNGKKTKTGYSTAAGVLEKLKKQHPIVDKVMSYRQLAKLKSTYADGLYEYIAGDGRIHSTFRQKVAATGRLSSTDPNLQNIPVRIDIGREIRKCFIPEDGHVFIDADYSQIELRLLAHLSEDPAFIEAFRSEQDIHRMTASQVFHVPFEEVTDLQRRNAKAVNFGIVYGISAFGLSEDLNITVKEANSYIEQYFERYPNVKNFLDLCVAKGKSEGAVKTLFNRVRPIPELSASNFAVRSFGERVAMNAPIQGSAADIIKVAMIQVYLRLKERNLKSKLILQVHDELLIEAPQNEVEEVTSLLVETMEHAVALSVPLTVDVHTGSNWYESK